MGKQEKVVRELAKMKLVRIPTGVEGFDKLLCGGIPQYFMVAYIGEPGTHKTITAIHNIVSAVEHGFLGIYITTEESVLSVIQQAKQFPKTRALIKYAEEGKIMLIDAIGYATSHGLTLKLEGGLPSVSALLELLEQAKKILESKWGKKPIFVVIDSISVFWLSAPAQSRKYAYLIKRKLSELGMTAVVTAQFAITTGGAFGFGVEHVADGIVEFAYRKVSKDVEERFVRVKKMRQTAHPTGWFRIYVDPNTEELKVAVPDDKINKICKRQYEEALEYWQKKLGGSGGSGGSSSAGAESAEEEAEEELEEEEGAKPEEEVGGLGIIEPEEEMGAETTPESGLGLIEEEET